MNHSPLSPEHLRRQIAVEAGRIMAEEGVRDYSAAKRKAAERLGVHGRGGLPSNLEVDEAMQEYQRLFLGAEHAARLRRLREVALEAMTLLADYEPRLVGGVLRGTAGPEEVVNLLLYADTPEEVALFLDARGIRTRAEEQRFRFGRREWADVPGWTYVAGDVTLRLAVFPPEALRRPPLSPVDGRAMRRAHIGAVRRLLTAAGPGAPGPAD